MEKVVTRDLPLPARFKAKRTLFEKLRLIIVMLRLLSGTPTQFLSIALDKIKHLIAGAPPPLEKVHAEPEIWQHHRYHRGIIPNTMSVISLSQPSSDKAERSLLILNGQLPTPELVRAVAFLGKVTAIVVPSQGHDSYALHWKELYPDAKVFCPASATAEVERSTIKVTGSSEKDLGAALAPHGWTVKTASIGEFACKEHGDELYITLERKNAKLLLTGCGVSLRKATFSEDPFMAFNLRWIGCFGPRVARLWQTMWLDGAKERQGVKRMFEQLRADGGYTAIVGLHGPAAVGVETAAKTLDGCCRSIN